MVKLPEDDRSGVLHQILSVFAWRKLNLSKIESRPLKTGLGNYFFIIDVLESDDHPMMQGAKEELAALDPSPLGSVGLAFCLGPDCGPRSVVSQRWRSWEGMWLPAQGEAGLRAALVVAQNGDTVTLNGHVELQSPVRIDKRLTLRFDDGDLNNSIRRLEGELFQIATDGVIFERMGLAAAADGWAARGGGCDIARLHAQLFPRASAAGVGGRCRELRRHRASAGTRHDHAQSGRTGLVEHRGERLDLFLQPVRWRDCLEGADGEVRLRKQRA